MQNSSFHAQMRTGNDKPAKITGQLLLRILAYAKPFIRSLTGMLVAILVTTFLSLLTPILFRNLIDVVLPAKDLNKLLLSAGILFMLPITKGVISVYQRKLNSEVGEGVIFDLRVSLYAKLQQMGIRFFTNTRIGELMSRLNNDVVGAQNAISNTIVSIVTNVIQAVAILTVMLSMQWQLTLVGIVILPVFIVLSKILGSKMREIARESMENNAQMNAHMNETLNIGGSLLIKLFGRQKDEEARFKSRANKVRLIGIKRAMFSTIFMLVIGLVGAFGTAIVYGMGGYYVIKGTFTIGTIVAFGAYLEQLYGALQSLANAPVDFSSSMVSFERVFEIIDLPIDIVEKENAIALTNIRGELEFRNVGFSYSTESAEELSKVKRYGQMDSVRAVLSGETGATAKEEPAKEEGGEITAPSQSRLEALAGISFLAKPGKLVALVGPSGAGKTTTTYLIPRLYDPTEGSILIDGIDLRDVTLGSLGSLIGMVTQENYLFHDTIRTNINYAFPQASQEKIEMAAKVANIHDFISALPDGYDTIVGERGYRLSGGEKQRIALARVILKDPKILVLDEATSSLDSESEFLIQEALKKIMAGRTSIVIAHRLSTILAADEILVMNRGEIVERGTHQELIAMNGLYAQLYETQFKSEQS